MMSPERASSFFSSFSISASTVGALLGALLVEPLGASLWISSTILARSSRLLRSPVCGLPSVASLSRVAWMKGLTRARVVRVTEEVGDVVARVAEREQQRGDRQLALAVDADVDEALLVDLELDPGAARRHQVRDEDLLLAVLRLHHVRARGADELRHDDALGAVDDVGAPVGHQGQVAHEDLLLADLTGLPVDERDLHRQGRRVGDVLLAAVLDGVVRLDVVVGHAGLPAAQRVLAELHREGAGEVLDRRDVVDRLAQALLDEPLEGRALDVDEVGDVTDLLLLGEGVANAGSGAGAQVARPPDESGRGTTQRVGSGAGVTADDITDGVGRSTPRAVTRATGVVLRRADRRRQWDPSAKADELTSRSADADARRPARSVILARR